MGNEALLDSKIKYKVTEAGADAIKHLYEWENPSLVLDGTPMEFPFNPIKVTTDAKSFIKSVEGGLEGSDGLRTFLLTHFFVPVDAVTESKAVKQTIAKDEKLGLEELTIETTLLGEEDLSGSKALKFSQKLSEKGNNFTVESTVWITAEGKILKVDGKYKDLPIPAANTLGEGTIKMEILK